MKFISDPYRNERRFAWWPRKVYTGKTGPDVWVWLEYYVASHFGKSVMYYAIDFDVEYWKKKHRRERDMQRG